MRVRSCPECKNEGVHVEHCKKVRGYAPDIRHLVPVDPQDRVRWREQQKLPRFTAPEPDPPKIKIKDVITRDLDHEMDFMRYGLMGSTSMRFDHRGTDPAGPIYPKFSFPSFTLPRGAVSVRCVVDVVDVPAHEETVYGEPLFDESGHSLIVQGTHTRKVPATYREVEVFNSGPLFSNG